MAERIGRKDLENLVKILQRETGMDFGLNWYGRRPRLILYKERGGERDISIRGSVSEVYDWIQVFRDGIYLGRDLGR
jgi:hypothetical protein